MINCNEWKTETPGMRKYGESKTTRIMMATVPHVTSGSGLRKFQADGFLFDRVYIIMSVAIVLVRNQFDMGLERYTPDSGFSQIPRFY